MLGKLLDQRYQVVEVLSQGGFGHTYIAKDTRRPGNPTCVVKHLKPATSDPDFLQTARRLFNSEAETLEKLGNHDHIPRLLAYFEETEEFYLVQEFIAGHTLSQELPLGTQWNEQQVIQLLQEVLSILQFVHSNGVIHRDIKPDNIIRCSQDNKLVLVDFGAVKQVKMHSLVSQDPLYDQTVAIGTPGYMPSEQGQGRPRPSSDIYALGMIGIQALTGMSPQQLAEDPETGEIVWRPYAHHVSELLAAILSQMVRHYFKYRYQSATQALQALQPLIHPHTFKARAMILSQMGRFYFREGYLYSSKVLSSLKELTKPCYTPPNNSAVVGTTSNSTTPTIQAVPSVQKTITVGTNGVTPAPSIPQLNWSSIFQSRRHRGLLIGVGTGGLVIILGMMSASQKPQPSAQVVQTPSVATTPQVSSTTAPQPSSPQIAQNKIQTQPAQPTQTKAQPLQTCVVTRTTNLRSGPSGKDIGEVKSGTKVTVTGQTKNGYIEITAPQPGWLYKRRAIRSSCPETRS